MWLICPSAGAGTRVLPFTYSKPKAFLKVAGMRLIDHILIKLKKTFPKGTNICFIVGYKKRQMIDYVTKNYSNYFNIKFVVQKPLGFTSGTPYFSGLADAILLARDYAQNDDCFIFFSDRLPMEDYTPILLNYRKEECDGIMNVKQVPNPQFYGVIQLNNEGYITRVVEKPKEYVSNYAVSGAYLFGKNMTPRFFELLEEQSKIPLENGKEHQIAPVIQKLIDEGVKLKINEMTEEMLDFGRPEGLLEGNRELLSSFKLKDPMYDEYFRLGNIVDSKIIPPVFIGKNVKISDSVIGPNVSIGDESIIEKCILSESVIGDATHLQKIISSNSIIGDYSILEDLIKTNITIGDSSYITTSSMKSV